jgi:putative MFS transporter
MFGRGATVASPFLIGYLMVSYQLPGVIWLMIGLLLVQIGLVFFWGVEPNQRSLESVEAEASPDGVKQAATV